MIGVLTVLLHAPQCLLASGSKVVVFLRNNSVVIGELLSVRDSELVLATRMGCSDEGLTSNERVRVLVSKRDIQEVKVEGRSYVMTGIAIGGGAGLVVGLGIALAQPTPDQKGLGSIGASLEHRQNVFSILVGSFACGLFVGGVAGEAASSGDKIIVTERAGDFVALKKFARFQNEDPDFLHRPGEE